MHDSFCYILHLLCGRRFYLRLQSQHTLCHTPCLLHIAVVPIHQHQLIKRIEAVWHYGESLLIGLLCQIAVPHIPVIVAHQDMKHWVGTA